MKNTLIILLIFTGIVNAQVVNIPDANFKAYLIAEGIDSDANGEIEVTEAQAATQLMIFNQGISDLTGVEAFINITSFGFSDTLTIQIDLSSNINLQNVNINNPQLTALDVSGLGNLMILICNNAQLTSLDLTGLVNLQSFSCYGNQITSLDFSDCQNLSDISCNSNLLTSIDVSNCHNLLILDCYFNPLISILAKNGSNESFGTAFHEGMPLEFVCVDESQMASVQLFVDTFVPNATLSSYCSFVPGGLYNTISGTVRYDLDNNGCTVSDATHPYIRIGIDDGINTGAFITNTTGNYNFYTQAGNFTLIPQIENPSYFTVSPPVTTVNFPIVDSSVTINDFCITANGFHPDLEVVLAPIEPARPGFDATYKLVYKNIGTETLSGSVSLGFELALMDLVNSFPMADNLTPGFLDYTFTNLTPFESREIEIIFGINSPTDTPPVNNGDILIFDTNIASSDLADDNIGNNNFTLEQTVVGSYDPNRIDCLEGEVVPPEFIGKYLHYIVKFENTGSDPAQNIIVSHIINETELDLGSLQIINASHEVETRITGNKVEFIFEGINLPARIADPIGGHGNVLFKIRSMSDLVAGDSVSASANIYFDYNFPIGTNEAVTTFTMLSKNIFVVDSSIMVYPNPADNIVNIKAATNIKNIQLFDIQGRVLQTIIQNKKAQAIDISNHNNGIYFLKITSEQGSKVEKIIKN